MNFIKRLIVSFIKRIISGFVIAALFVASYFLIKDYVIAHFYPENTNAVIILTVAYVLVFFYLFINTPMKYAFIVTAFFGLGNDLAKELVMHAATHSVEEEISSRHS